MAEALKISLLRAIYVEVVGVGSRDDSHPRTEPVEGAVELIGLNDDVVAGVGEDIVRAIVLRDAAEESVAVDMALVHDMSTHRRGRGLAVSTCHAESFVGTSQDAEHLCTLLYLEAIVAEPCQFLVRSGDSRCIDDEARSLVSAGMRDLINVLIVVDEHAFFF